MHSAKLFRFVACAGFALLAAVGTTRAYDLIRQNGQPITWWPGSVTMQVKLDNSRTLQDGTTFAMSAVAAMDAWNAVLGDTQLTAQIQPVGIGTDGDDNHEIFFASDLYGDAFGANVLAVTTDYYSTQARSDGSYPRVEADIIFNNTYTWDSYRGPLQYPEEFRRVAIHELGHVLGLDHPDQATPPQTVDAIMNHTVSDRAALAQDDINGAQYLYGSPGSVTHPGNDNFSNAYTIAAGTTQVTGTNLWATKQHFEPAHAPGQYGGASVWWKWTAPSSGSLTITTEGSDFDTLLAAYTGSSVNALTQLAANDDVERGVIRTSTITFNVSVGTTYFFAVDGWDGEMGNVTVNLAFTNTDSPPSITSHPSNQTILEGGSVTFSAAASGQPAPGYQWQKNGVNINGATSTSYTIAVVVPGDAGDYRLVATNSAGSATSNAATLTVTPLGPIITSTTPVRQVYAPGQSTTLSVSATSSGSISYQWLHNGRIVSGASGASLPLPNLSRQDGGWYVALLTDSFGTRRTAPMFLTVAPASTGIRLWGASGSNAAIPSELNDAIEIVDGRNYFELALKRNGTVVAWGAGSQGQTSVPAGLSNVVALAAGTYHALALKSNGTVVGWGSGSSSQLNIPSGLDGVVAISAGDVHSVALKSDGTVVAWGTNYANASLVPSGLNQVCAIAAGGYHTLALKTDGTVVAWGYNDYGQATVPAGLHDVIAIAAGYIHSLALKADGTVVAWGFSGDYPDDGIITVPASLTNVVGISGGQSHSLTLKADGTVVGWGNNRNGQTTLPSEGLDHVFQVRAGNQYSLALRDTAFDTPPHIVTQPSSVVVAENGTATFSVTAIGAGPFTYQWRKNGGSIAGATSATLTLDELPLSAAGSYDVVVNNAVGATPSAAVVLTVNPIPVVTNTGASRRKIGIGQALNLGVSATGTGPLAYQWMLNGRPISGATGNTLNQSRLTYADGGCYYVEVTDANGTRRSAPFFVLVAPVSPQLVAWGRSLDGSTVVPSGLTDVVSIAAGANHSMALKGDGTVVAFGYNYYGQAQVPAGLGNAVALSGGLIHSLALRADGTVLAWGNNSDRQCTIPIGLNDAVAVAAGDYHSLALRLNGKVVAWGSSTYGQCAVPGGLSDAIAISAGSKHSLALKANGKVVAWGDNTHGQCNVPADLSNVVAIAASDICSLALKSDGSVVFWGDPYYFYSEPTRYPPAGLADVAALATNTGGTVALKADGTVVAWGSNSYGEAVVPANLINGVAIARGMAHALVLYDANPPTAPEFISQPTSAQALTGSGASFTASVRGQAPLTFQWQYAVGGSETWSNVENGASLSGATTDTLTLTDLTLQQDSLRFRVVVTNALGEATSQVATLTVRVAPPSITQPLQAMLVRAGSSVSLSITASGLAPLSYQWSLNGAELSGEITSSLAIADFQIANAGTYSVRVTNAGGSVTSSATVDVATLPTITTQPQSVTRYAGESLTLSVAATSNAPITYQWKKSGVAIDGATQSSLQFTPVRAADAGDYSVEVTTLAGSVSSGAATVTVLPSIAPAITQQPQNRTVALQAPVSFTVQATGNPAPTYQWQRLPAGTTTWFNLELNNGSLYSGIDAPELIVWGGTQLSNNGDKFRCVVSNVAGSVTSSEATLTVSNAAPVTRVSSGYLMTHQLRGDGTLWSSGSNYAGQLADGTTVAHVVPGNITNDVAAIGAGFDHVFYIKSDGSLWAAGDNQAGELGDNSTTNRATPVQVATGVAAAIGGYRHSLFRKSDGTLWAMGLNSAGQLGDSTTSQRISPVQIATAVVDCAAGFNHSLFVKSDGTAWAVGNGSGGQFGNGATSSTSTPIQVATNVAHVATFYHALFLKRDGTVWASGRNERGQVGDGTTASRLTSIQVADGVVEIAVGALHSLMLKADGTVWAMGANDRGQLGDGSRVDRLQPVQVASGAAAISAGIFQSFIIKTDGTFWVAGANEQGQLGDGTTTDRATFGQIASGAGGLARNVTNMSATNSAASNRVSLTWNHSRGSLYYRVWRHSTNDSTLATLIADRVVGNFYEDWSGTPGLNYYYWVQPVNQFGALPVGASAVGRQGEAGSAPIITIQPAAQSVSVGASVTFSVAVEGTAPFSYAWRKDQQPINGASASSYTITGAQLADVGDYDVIVSNSFGSITSASAALTVSRLAQAITFAALSDITYSSQSVPLVATTNSGLPITFTVVSGPATVSGTSLTLTGVGTVNLRASQAGDSTFAPAADVERSFVVRESVVAWQNSFFTEAELLDPAVSGSSADPDGDGIANLVEYALGLDPKSASGSALPAATLDSGNWSFTYTRPADRTDIHYRVECSADLTSWSEVNVTHARVTSQDGTETWQATYPAASAPTCFFRLVVTH